VNREEQAGNPCTSIRDGILSSLARSPVLLLVCVLFLKVCGAGTETAQASGNARRNKIVVAVEKTRNSVVMIKVVKHGKWSRQEVIGTGVIVDERGYVVTSHHVISRGEKIRVLLVDGTEVACALSASLPRYDLAVLKLPSLGEKKLQALRFAPTQDLMVGEDVIAVGHPFGYQHTVSRGIISALGRSVEIPTGYTLKDLIQTDASINAGNSGGPLLNINGELIGIIMGVQDGAQGVAFALKAGTIQKLLSQELSAGKIAHITHGLVCREVACAKTDTRGCRQQVVVQAIVSPSPAARAGLQEKDVILRVGSKAISNRFDLERALWHYRAGDRVATEVLRKGSIRQLSLTLNP
jgi:serine protease Do